MHLSIADLRYSYRGRPDLLRSVSLAASSGESLALLGPSGSGKSTLLALVGGLLRPQAGTITTNPADARQRPATAWIRQSNDLLPHRSLIDNVALPLLARGDRRVLAEDRAREELFDLGLADLATCLVRHVSGGEAQRTAVARGAVAPPAILLADEPTANLDRSNAERVAVSLTTRFPESLVLIATHDPAVAAHCSRVLRISEGRLEACP